jgi:hypothetical protein
MLMRARLSLALALAMAAAIAADLPAAAQTSGGSAALRKQIERRFEVLPLQNGVALRPKSASSGVRSIELTDGTIAIDGAPATGAELHDKLGADADAVIRLSYLDPEARRALFAPVVERSEEAPAAEAPVPPVPPATTAPPRTHRSAARVRLGGSVTVAADETVESVVVIGGSAHIDGQVLDDVVVIGGRVELGPLADVGKDVTAIGGAIRRNAGAHIGGDVNEVGPGMDLRGLPWRGMPFNRAFWWGSTWGGLIAFLSTMTRLLVLCVLASIVMLVGRDYVERVGARAAAEPVKAGLVGLFAHLLFLPTLVLVVVVLVVTIIGIPLLMLVPFAVLALAVLFVIGFTSVAYHVGRLATVRFGSAELNPMLATLVGILVVMSPVLFGRLLGLGGGLLLPIALPVLLIGFLAEYAAWTVGFGAIALNRFDRRSS